MEAESPSSFQAAYQSALAQPEFANLMSLWELVEPLLPNLSEAEQLQIAGTVLMQLAELYANKAERLLQEWQDDGAEQEPSLTDDLLAGLVQRTMYLDLSDLVRPSQPPRRPPIRSVAGAVDKNKVLEMVRAIEDSEVEKQKALSVAHDEDVMAWRAAVAEWLQQQDRRAVPLPEIVRAVNMPLVKVWLALLLGGFVLESKGEFYANTSIWVRSLSRETGEQK